MLPHCRNGMWYQVVDRENEQGNYLETSGTLMMAYALMKGARLGMLEKEYGQKGKKVFESTIKQKLCEKDGKLLLNGICESAGLGRHPETGVIRDGSYAYYTGGERICINNGHGIGALLLAANEYVMLQDE